MKKLKLDHKLADLVVRGEKRSTWRLFDDKDLSVNDNVELIDKIDPKDPETWKPIGVAHINQVIEKRLGDIDESDTGGHRQYASRQEMVLAFQKYYGSNVNIGSPVKIIFFDFTPLNASEKLTIAHDQSNITEVKIFADGGSRGNPGPSASGYVLTDMEGKVLVDKGAYLGITTNNQAEYQALKSALEEGQKMHARNVSVFMDSLLVINQMKGVFKVSNRDLWPIHDAIKKLTAAFNHVSFTHIPREMNKLADAAVNRALDEELKIPPQNVA